MFKISNVSAKQTEGLDSIQVVALSLLAESGYRALAAAVGKGTWGMFVERGLSIQTDAADTATRVAEIDAFVGKVKAAALDKLMRDMAHGLGLDKEAKGLKKADDNGSTTSTERAALAKAVNYRNRIVSAWEAGVALIPGISTGRLEAAKREALSKVTPDTEKPAHVLLQERGAGVSAAAELVSKQTETVQAAGMAAAASFLRNVNRALLALGRGQMDAQEIALLDSIIEDALPKTEEAPATAKQATPAQAELAETLANIPDDVEEEGEDQPRTAEMA